MQYGTSKYNSQKWVKFDEKVWPLVKLYDAVYNLNGIWVQSTALVAPMGIVVEIGNDQRATIAISWEVPVNVIDGAILLPLIQNTVYYYDVGTNTISTAGTHKIGKSLISRSNSADGDAIFGTIVIDFSVSSGWGSDKNYTQAFVAQSTVIVTHNLAKYPSVTLLDVAGDEIIGDVLQNSVNQVTVTFNTIISGTVICN